MSMVYEEEKNILRFDVPNSEASIDAQHHGIVDRTVGSYYMSENNALCEEFLENFTGEYYIDLFLSIENSNKILNILIKKGYETAFKSLLKPQLNSIEALKWYINKGNYFYKIDNPTINDNRKYLKLNNDDVIISSFRTLILGDLCSLFIKKIGKSGFIFYIDKNPKFDEILNNNTVLKWMK